eukprot:75830_1
MSQEEKNGYNFDSDPNIPICRYFKRGCMRGDSCKFRHVLEQNNGYNKNNHNNNKEENKFNKQENKAENIYENEGIYDGHEDRIQTNRNFLNKSSDMLLKMDKLFIKKREKGLILHIIRE